MATYFRAIIQIAAFILSTIRQLIHIKFLFIFLMINCYSFGQNIIRLSITEDIPNDTFAKLIIENRIRSIAQWDFQNKPQPVLKNYREFDKNGNEILWLKSYAGVLTKYKAKYNDKNQRIETCYFLTDTSKLSYCAIYTFNTLGFLTSEKKEYPNGKSELVSENTMIRKGDTTFTTRISYYDGNKIKIMTRVFFPSPTYLRIDDFEYERTLFMTKENKKTPTKVKSSYQKYDNKGRVIEKGKISYKKELKEFVNSHPEIIWDLHAKFLGKQPLEERKYKVIMETKESIEDSYDDVKDLLLFECGLINEILEGKIQGKEDERPFIYQYDENDDLIQKGNQKLFYNLKKQLVEIQGGGRFFKRQYIYNEKDLPIEVIDYDNEITKHSKFYYEYFEN